MDDDGRRGFGVGGQPLREALVLLNVVGAQDAAHVGVVVGVAVGFAVEDGALEVGDAGFEVRVPAGHGRLGRPVGDCLFGFVGGRLWLTRALHWKFAKIVVSNLSFLVLIYGGMSL